MKLTPLAIATALTLSLSGCGSDSDNSVETPTPDSGYPLEKYVVMDVDHQPKTIRTHKVVFGRFDDKIKPWSRDIASFEDGSPKPDYDADNDGRITVWDAEAAGIVNPSIDYQNISSELVVEFLAQNPDGLGQYSTRPDVFVQGQYSVFDLLRYMVYSDDSLRFESVTPYTESKYKTTEFVLSQDINGDGDFTNDGEYSQSSNWYFRFKTSGGDFMRAIGEPDGEATYLRMDEMWAQDDMVIRFQPFYEVTTKRRQYIWQKEVERLAAQGGKYLLEQLRVVPKAGGMHNLVENLEVTAHNLRPDVFQPGVITGVDLFMSAIDQGYDIKLSYWPTLDTGASVYSYSINEIEGDTSSSGQGWMMLIGEDEIGKDYGNKLNALPQCNWDQTGASASSSDFPIDECLADYQFGFGANVLHLMTDVYVMNYPKQFAQAVWGSHYPQWGMEEYNGNDGSKDYDFGQGDSVSLEKLVAETANDSATILTPTHYGWGKADCMLCHDADTGHKNGAPLPINSVDGFDEPQAYFCATCHGSNGAPKGHGASARCFWCHSNSKTPDFHGDAFAKRTVNSKLDDMHQAYVDGELPEDVYFNHGSKTNTMTRDKSGNAASYPESGVQSGTNSDWSMSKTFPDPYSCMTCHANP